MSIYHLPKLGFSYDALEPYIDAQTMEVHHDGHHFGYVKNLNKTLEDYPEFQKPVEELLAGIETLPLEIKTQVKNYAGGHANHTLFWTLLTAKAQGQPSRPLNAAIDKYFGNFSNFQDGFTQSASSFFSNGWTWLCTDRNNDLSIFSTKDHESPISQGMTPLLVIDVWEHAYYLKYQNRRAQYIQSFWQIVNWQEVSQRWEDIRTRGVTNREWRLAS